MFPPPARRKGEPKAIPEEPSTSIQRVAFVTFEQHEASFEKSIAGVDMWRYPLRQKRDVGRR